MAKEVVATAAVAFDAPDLWETLQEFRSEPGRYDSLAFGLVAMDLDGVVTAYNKPEATLAGITAEHVLGLTFFTDVAPCTNNYLVAGRFEEESSLDETIDYVFTVKMRPKRVRLRLLKSEAAECQYLAVQWN